MVVRYPLWRLKGREGSGRSRAELGTGVLGVRWEETYLGWTSPETKNRQTDTQTTERPGAPPKEAKTLTSDGLMNRQTETHSRKLQTRQTGQLEQLGAESDSG